MTFLDTLHNETRFVQQCVQELDHIARAFEVVGNAKMARVLRTISTDLERSQKNLTDAYHGKVHDDMVKAEQSTTNMVNAALAVVLKDTQ